MQKPVCCDTVPQFGIYLGAAVVPWESHFTTFRICKMEALGSVTSAVIFILKFYVALVRLVVVIILSIPFVPCAFLSYPEKGEAITLLMVSCCPGKYLATKRFLFYINKKLLSKYSSIRHGILSLGKCNSDALIFNDILEYQNKLLPLIIEH